MALSPSTAGYLPTIPQPVPLNSPTQPPVTAPTPRTFTGTAPTATPTAGFTAPDPMNFAHSPDYQYQLDQAQKARERSAAARGTLLTGGTVKALQRDAEGIAAGDYQNVYNRALSSYTTNRATNAQNFGENLDTYQGNLSGFNANVGADSTYGRLGMEANDTNAARARQAAIDEQINQQQRNDYATAQNNLAGEQAAQLYAAELERARQENAASTAAGAARQAQATAPMASAAPGRAALGGSLPSRRPMARPDLVTSASMRTRLNATTPEIFR